MAKKKTNESPADAPIDFETCLGEIEKIVRALEGGELTLDHSLQQYETAVGKMRQCYQLLEVAERRISVLAGFDADGNPVTEPMPADGEGGGNDSLISKQKNRGRRRGAAGASGAAGVLGAASTDLDDGDDQ